MDTFKILIVDDETEFLETLMKRLQKRNLSVFGTGSGAEAIDFLGKNNIDVVVLDVKMPGMDGIETLRAIKTKHPLIEVLMLTGHANVEVAIAGMEQGAFDYLMKPINIDDLLYKLRDAYKKREIHEKKIREIEKETQKKH